MINIRLGLSGEYRMVVSKDAECKEIVSVNSFKNLITDNGFELIGTTTISTNFTNICARFCVGSGSTTPAVTDTSLANLVAVAISAPTTSVSTSYDDGYTQTIFSYQFGAGFAAGNLSEIGIGESASSLFSRALILDSGGNPTTITVLPNEYLTVYYTLRCAIPKTDQTFTFTADIGGTPTSVTAVVRPARANSSTENSWRLRTGIGQIGGNAGGVYAGSLGTPISTPSGASLSISQSDYTVQSYSASSLQRKADIDFTINQANLSGGVIKSIVHTLGPGCWQIEFTPGIPKNNTQTAKFTIGYTWGRI